MGGGSGFWPLGPSGGLKLLSCMEDVDVDMNRDPRAYAWAGGDTKPVLPVPVH